MKNTILLLALLLSFGAFGQSRVRQTRLILQNGTELRGQLIDAYPPYKLQSPEGNIWIFESDEVQKIDQGLNPDLHQQKGFLNITELGILSGANDQDALQPRRYSSMSFRTFNGYQFAPGFALGLSMGGDWYEQTIITPLALSLRGDFCKNRITPFYAFEVGKGFVWLAKQGEGESAKGGYILAIGSGLKIKMPGQTALILSLGYQRQSLEITQTEIGWGGPFTRTTRTNLNRMLLRFGFGF